MKSYRHFFGLLSLVASVAFGSHDARAQPTAPQPSETARQAKVRRTLNDEVDRIFNAGVAAQKKGDCVLLSQSLSQLDEWPSEGIRARTAILGARLSFGQRQKILRRKDQLAEKLRRLDCPPGSGVRVTATPQLAPILPSVAVQIGAGVSVLNGIKVANGGLGGEQSVESMSFEALMVTGAFGVIPDSEVQLRLYGEAGKSETGVAGQGTTAVQANGGIQVIQGAGPVSADSSRAAELFRVGGEIQLSLPGLPTAAGTFVPFIGTGFEHARLETELFLNWQPINFSITESTDVTTNRAFAFIGGQHNFANFGGIQFFTRGRLNLNLDFVDGSASYHTMQLLNFDETVFGNACRTGLTVGGRVDFGAATTFANGVRVQASAFAGLVPVWQWENRVGQPGTLIHDHEANYGVQAAIRIPITGPQPLEPLRDLVFRW